MQLSPPSFFLLEADVRSWRFGRVCWGWTCLVRVSLVVRCRSVCCACPPLFVRASHRGIKKKKRVRRIHPVFALAKSVGFLTGLPDGACVKCLACCARKLYWTWFYPLETLLSATSTCFVTRARRGHVSHDGRRLLMVLADTATLRVYHRPSVWHTNTNEQQTGDVLFFFTPPIFFVSVPLSVTSPLFF